LGVVVRQPRGILGSDQYAVQVHAASFPRVDASHSVRLTGRTDGIRQTHRSGGPRPLGEPSPRYPRICVLTSRGDHAETRPSSHGALSTMWPSATRAAP